MEVNPEVNKQATELLLSQKTNSTFHPPLYYDGIEVIKSMNKNVWDLHLMKSFILTNTLMNKLKLFKRVLVLSNAYPIAGLSEPLSICTEI